MNYRFNCEKCRKSTEIDIPIDKYDSEKDKQVCECGGKLSRVIEWQGWAKASGDGWYGKNGSNVI